MEPEEAEGEASGEAVLMEEDLIRQSLRPAGTACGCSQSTSCLWTSMCWSHMSTCRACSSLTSIFRLLGMGARTLRTSSSGMGQDEEQFSMEIPLGDHAYLWADKYRPRKPRFANCVHMGFEWNKYNQMHYDLDNHPPKIVQGYKFNIFYPDLISKRTMPETCVDNLNFAILRFYTGRSYEDIAFKIVGREWESSHRHGFRCQFANGIFQLWFHFKCYGYRL